MSHDTTTPENRPADAGIFFPPGAFGVLNTGRGYTGWSSLRAIFAVLDTATLDDTAVTRIRYQTDRDGLLALLTECDKAQEAITDAMRTVGVLTVYADREQIGMVELGGIGWLTAGLAELKSDIDEAARAFAAALAHGDHLPDGGQEGGHATP